MTDTEILDYLSDSYTLRRNAPTDIQIGSVTFTLGLKPGSLREVIEYAIGQDQQRMTKVVTGTLLGDSCGRNTDMLWHRCSRGTFGCDKRHDDA